MICIIFFYLAASLAGGISFEISVIGPSQVLAHLPHVPQLRKTNFQRCARKLIVHRAAQADRRTDRRMDRRAGRQSDRADKQTLADSETTSELMDELKRLHETPPSPAPYTSLPSHFPLHPISLACVLPNSLTMLSLLLLFCPPPSFCFVSLFFLLFMNNCISSIT